MGKIHTISIIGGPLWPTVVAYEGDWVALTVSGGERKIGQIIDDGRDGLLIHCDDGYHRMTYEDIEPLTVEELEALE